MNLKLPPLAKISPRIHYASSRFLNDGTIMYSVVIRIKDLLYFVTSYVWPLANLLLATKRPATTKIGGLLFKETAHGGLPRYTEQFHETKVL
jgi:hypothetical protein